MADPHKTTGEHAKEVLLRAIAAVIELVTHLAVVASLLLGMWLLEKLVHHLWNKDYLFFNKVKLRYIFDGADLMILVGFLAWGVYSVINAYVRPPK